MGSTWEEIVIRREEFSKINFEYWLQNNLFSFQWWMLLIIIVISYVIWWRFVDKKRLSEILLCASIITVISSFLDILGTDLMLWGYPNMLLPLIPPLCDVDYAVLPVVYSLIYQYYQTWRTFIIAMLIMAIVFSFIIEPILVWMKIYDMHSWKYIYSFPIYIVMGTGVKWIVDKVTTIQKMKIR